MDVLVIAPDTGLDLVSDEVAEVVNALGAEVLQGRVTVRDVMRSLRSPHDLVWFPIHLDADGIELTDGVIPTDRLIQFLRSPIPGALYFNTCTSLEMAADIHDQLGIPIICTVSDIPDDEAYVTGAQLANYLGRGLPLREAYELSRPGGRRNYRMIGTRESEDRIDRMIHMMDAIHRDLREEIRRVEERFNQRIDDIEADVIKRFDRGYEYIDHRYQWRLTRRNTLMWIGGFLIFSLVMALGYVDVRHALNISWQASMIVSLPLLIMSGALIALGLGMSWRPDP